MTIHARGILKLLLLLSLLLVAVGCGDRDSAQNEPASTTVLEQENEKTDAAEPTESDASATDETAQNADATPVDGEAVAQQIAATLQSCSYDGTSVSFGIGGDPPTNCVDMIDMVMQFTGLPTNFYITEADIPNAAAVLFPDENNVLVRVIGFNPEFIDSVNSMVGGNKWAAVSIMAHEVGHHLSGHTLQPGGSQPPIELEADKFSGFVLQKMGASLDDALVAIKSIVPEGPDGPTHPGQGKRVDAITEGWMQSCVQSGRTDCDSGSSGSAPTALLTMPGFGDTPAAGSAEPTAESAEPTAEPTVESAEPTAETATTATAQGDILPVPDPNALPSKGTQFIYDELGILDPTTRQAAEQRYFEHAQQTGAEIVTMVVDDLGGYSADEYAWIMMRQLRVGKLDVGNGVVMVYAPNQGETGLAVGPGIMGASLDFVEGYRELVDVTGELFSICGSSACDATTTELILMGMEGFIVDTSDRDYQIRYQNFGEIYAKFVEEEEAGNYDHPETKNAVIRLSATVEALDADPGDDLIGSIKVQDGYSAVRATGPDGETLMLYLLPTTASLQSAGPLEVGTTYTFVARNLFMNADTSKMQQFEIFSYDLLPQ